MLRRTLLLAGVLGALVLPAAAAAATVSKTGATLRYVATPGERDLVRLFLEDGGTTVRFEITAPTITPVAPCFASSGVKCPLAPGDRVSLELGDGNDVVNFLLLSDVPVPMTIDGGPGDDSLRGGPLADTLQGGDGGDVLTGAGGADALSGGAGFDIVSFFGLSGGVRVSLDDVADDGRSGGAEGANVRSDIEDVRGTASDDTLIGSPGANELDGGAGNDTLDGRGGIDTYLLGAGNDTGLVRDGLGERVVCASGDDTVTADDIDEFSDCEQIASSGALVRDLDRDGIAKPADCNDAAPAIRPGAPDAPDDGVDQDCNGVDATDADRDDDGVPRPFDCDDGNPKAAPGKRERYGNKVDEDCDGRANPLQTITTQVRARFVAAPGGARITRLQVVRPRKGTTVQVRCKRAGCPFAKRAVKIRTGGRTLDLRDRFGLTRLGDQVLEVRLLRRDSIGRVTRFSGRGGAIPATRILCLPPGKKKPGRCRS